MALTSAEKMRLKREREKLEAEQALLEGLLTQEAHEAMVRKRFGYTASETRTERERSDAAARMLGRGEQEYWDSRHPAVTSDLPDGHIE